MRSLAFAVAALALFATGASAQTRPSLVGGWLFLETPTAPPRIASYAADGTFCVAFLIGERPNPVMAGAYSFDGRTLSFQTPQGSNNVPITVTETTMRWGDQTWHRVTGSFTCTANGPTAR